MRSICLCFFLLIPSVLLDGTPRNYIGMTRSEVATVLEKEAFRSRWSGNRFLIVDIPRHSGFHYLRIAQDVLVNETLMKSPQWDCTLKNAPKPILIHCRHGSDRTGAIVAACRIVFENWPEEQAVAELKDPKFGHHTTLYKNIPQLIRKTDWEKIRYKIMKDKQQK